jgi:hypothetical protein
MSSPAGVNSQVWPSHAMTPTARTDPRPHRLGREKYKAYHLLRGGRTPRLQVSGAIEADQQVTSGLDAVSQASRFFATVIAMASRPKANAAK